MANEIHTLNIDNTSYTIQPRVLGPMSTFSTGVPCPSVSGVIRYDTAIGDNPFGSDKSDGMNNAVLSIGRHDSDRYTTQLGFSRYGIYGRWFFDATPDTTTPWRRFIMDDGVNTLKLDTPNVNIGNTNVSNSTVGIRSNSININSDSINIGGYGQIASLDSAINIGNNIKDLYLNTVDNIFIGDSESEINPALDISASSINISGGKHTGTNILLGNYLAFDEGHSQAVYTYCDIVPLRAVNTSLSHASHTIGTSTNRFYAIYSAYSYASEGFFQSSDERLKTFGNNIKVDFDALSKMRKAYFTWNDKPDTTHIGVSAQEVQEIYPEVVTETGGQLSVDYAKLSVVALAAVDELHKKNVELEARLAKLEALLLK